MKFTLKTFASFAALLTFTSLLSLKPTQADEPGAPVAVDDEPRDPKHYIPGKGFVVAEGEQGSLKITAYALLRYLNQLPAEQSFTDHLGNQQTIDTRQDIQLHRILIHFQGFLFSKKFTYDTTVWSVNSTTTTTSIASLNYEFEKAFVLGGGIGAVPGTRSLNYEHPYFLGTDRQMADEFFRPSFSAGVWLSGTTEKTYYRFMIADSLSLVNINATQLTRDFAYAATFAWMPTTGEFGPKGGFGDFEYHDKLATRFGFSATWSPREDRFNQINNPNPDNTTIRLSDSVLLFQTGALAPNTTVQKADYKLLALDASMKYRGFFLFGEAYFRRLGKFDVTGPPPPINTINDTGFMIQTSYMLSPKKWEVYGVHSQIYGEFNRAWELTGGLNYYPYQDRHLKINLSVTYVDRSPTSSLFGYFVGGQKGPILAACTDFTF